MIKEERRAPEENIERERLRILNSIRTRSFKVNEKGIPNDLS